MKGKKKKVQGSELKVQGSMLRVQGFRVQGSMPAAFNALRSRVQSSRFNACGVPASSYLLAVTASRSRGSEIQNCLLLSSCSLIFILHYSLSTILYSLFTIHYSLLVLSAAEAFSIHYSFQH